MMLPVNDQISLESIALKHAQGIYDVADNNRQHFSAWLPWVNRMHDASFIDNFIRGALERHNEGTEWAFVMLKNDVVIGRIGVQKIDNQNKIGEIGYWIAENEQGKGAVTQSCKALINFCFNNLVLNRLEIKCGTKNKPSQRIPERLGFTQEGIIRQGELIGETFIDLKLYSLLKKEARLG